MCCSGKIKAFTLPFAQRLPWGAHLQAAAQRPQPFPSRVVAIPRTPLGLPTDSSLFILPERNEEEYTERLAWHAQDGDQSGSHLFCPHSSGQSRSHDRAPLQWDRECTPQQWEGDGDEHWLANDSHEGGGLTGHLGWERHPTLMTSFH